MTYVTAMKLKIKRDTLNKMFCMVHMFYVKQVNLWTDNMNISWLLVYDNVFCNPIFQIPATVSGRPGSEST